MLKIRIAETWEPNDFAEVFSSIENTYYKALKADVNSLSPHYDIRYETRDHTAYVFNLDRLNRRLTEDIRYDIDGVDRLIVSKIHFASPGIIDFLGLGKICEIVAQSIGRIVKFYEDRNLRREADVQARLHSLKGQLEIEEHRETLKSLKIKNAREILELEREFPEKISGTFLPLLIRDQDILSERVADGRITGAESSDDIV